MRLHSFSTYHKFYFSLILSFNHILIHPHSIAFTLTFLTSVYTSRSPKTDIYHKKEKSPYCNFNTNTWKLNSNTGIFSKKQDRKNSSSPLETLKKRDFLMESPAPLLQRYNIFRPKANSVKIARVPLHPYISIPRPSDSNRIPVSLKSYKKLSGIHSFIRIFIRLFS